MKWIGTTSLRSWYMCSWLMSLLPSDMNLIARKRDTTDTEQSGSTSWKDAAATARAKGRACVPRARAAASGSWGLSFSTFASQRHAVPLPAISSVHFKSNSSQHSQEKIAGYNGNTYTFRLNSLSFVPNIQIFILLYISLKNS